MRLLDCKHTQLEGCVTLPQSVPRESFLQLARGHQALSAASLKIATAPRTGFAPYLVQACIVQSGIDYQATEMVRAKRRKQQGRSAEPGAPSSTNSAPNSTRTRRARTRRSSKLATLDNSERPLPTTPTTLNCRLSSLRRQWAGSARSGGSQSTSPISAVVSTHCPTIGRRRRISRRGRAQLHARFYHYAQQAICRVLWFYVAA